MKKLFFQYMSLALISFATITLNNSAFAYSILPTTLNYQGYLSSSDGIPQNDTLNMTFRLYTTAVGGSVIWQETRDVVVEKGLFSVELGEVTPLNIPDFSTPLFLGISVNADAEMIPRKPLTLTSFSIKAEDANSVEGISAADLDQSAHVLNLSNPHNVTAAQIGALISDDLVLHTKDESAHHKKTESFTELLDSIEEVQIPASIVRKSELTWNNISGKPAGFADNVDNDSGGDITAVFPGVGLNGGAASGDATLNLNVPLALDGSSSFIVSATNDSTGIGVHGFRGIISSTSAGGSSAGVRGENKSTTGSGIGVHGTQAGSGWGVYGYTPSGRGVYGNSTDGIGNYGYSNSGTAGYFSTLNGYGLVVANGNVGIGDTTPNTERLTIYGDGSEWHRGFIALKNNANDAGIRLYRSDSDVAHHIYNDYAIGNKLRIAPGGSYTSGGITVEQAGLVGIGTNNPNSTLHVNGNGVDAAFRAQVNGTTKLFVSPLGTVVAGSNVTTPADVPFQVFPGSSGGDASLANGSGYMVIGSEGGSNIVFDNNEILARNNGAAAKLFLNYGGTHVVVPGLEITGGADLVEPFNVASKYKDVVLPGMVMAIDADNPGQLRIADKEYDKTVAGVISGANGINPGLSMSQQGTDADGSHPLALTGRLYALADADYGEIQPGDLLTTSNTPGHVKKVKDHARAQGAIIGKAMTRLEQGKGHVLVLVSLQ